MKKYIYLVPLVLLILCIFPATLHKDTVGNAQGGDLTSLRPSHWKMKDFESNASIDLLKTTSLSNDDLTKVAEPYSQNAKFRGFPFGFYFSKSEKTSISSLKVSAYSWLWATVDGLLIIFSLLIAIFFNRRPNESELAQAESPYSPGAIYPTPTPPTNNITKPSNT